MKELHYITELELARVLVAQGKVDKAAAIYTDLIIRQEHAALPEAVSALAKIAYDEGKWDDAAELWSLGSLIGPSNIEAFVKLSHCLVELQRFRMRK